MNLIMGKIHLLMKIMQHDEKLQTSSSTVLELRLFLANAVCNNKNNFDLFFFFYLNYVMLTFFTLPIPK